MNSKHTKLIFIISIFITILVFGVFVFLFKVVKNKNEHTSKVLVTLTKKIEDKENSEILISKFTELESIEETINGFFVDPSKIDTFVDYLEKLGVSNNTDLVVKSVEINPKKKTDISVKVLISGDFNNVMKVIYLLENISYYSNLNQAFINKTIKSTQKEVDGVMEDMETSLWQADVSFNVLNLNKK